MEKTLFAILLGGVLLNNYALQSYLGVSTLLGASKDTKKAVAMGGAVTVVSLLSGLITWPMDRFVLAPMGMEYLRILTFVAVILAVSYLVGAVVKMICKKSLGIFLPLVALNSSVLALCLNNVSEGLDFLQTLVQSLAVGLGFLLAMVLFCGVRSKIEDQYIPKAFRGLPIHLMAACILALALYAF